MSCTLDCLDELVELANIQKTRVLAMWEEERRSDSLNPSLNTAIRTYKDILLSVQEMKFDLGLDEYKRGIPRAQTPENAAPASVTRPDDLIIQQQVLEAIATVEDIFRKRGVPEYRTGRR
jgi:hypothetical protein